MIEEMIENAIGEYFRGGSSYEDAVSNRLNALETTGVATTLAVSNMNSGLADAINSTTNELQGLRSDFQSAAVGLYNQGQSIRQDIQTQTNAIQSMAMGVTSAIHESTYEIVASQQMLANTFNHGFNSVNNTINLGFGLVGNKIDVLSEDVSSKLDEIQDILNNPRLTQSRELYREALRSYKRGFYEEALADCLGAIEKNKTDYISWYLLGLIYLYGAGENSNVINLVKAEEAFLNAAKYIKPDIAKSDEAKLFASDIYYNLGFSRLAKSNDYLIENKVDDSNTKLLESEEASNMAYQLSQENLLARYEQAKELHFLGKDDETIKLLEEVIRKNKNFAIKAINDKNFESIWSDIKQLIEKLKLEACQLIRESLDEFINKISSGVDTGHNSIIEKVRKTTLQNKETIINKAIELKKENIDWFNSKKDRKLAQYKDIEQKDYFSVLDALTKVPSLYENIEVFVRNCIINTNNIVKRQVEEQQNLEIEERRRQEEEQKRKEEEAREKKRIAAEEEKKRQEIEKKIELEKQQQERRKSINRHNRIYRIGFLLSCILMFGFQWSFILFQFGNIEMYIPYLSILPCIFIAFFPVKDVHDAFGDSTIFQTIMLLILGGNIFLSTTFCLDLNLGFMCGVVCINVITTIIYGSTYIGSKDLEYGTIFSWAFCFILGLSLFCIAGFVYIKVEWIAFILGIVSLICFWASGYFFTILGLVIGAVNLFQSGGKINIGSCILVLLLLAVQFSSSYVQRKR